MQAIKRSDVTLAPSLITDVKVSRWGSDLVVNCLDDPLTRRRFALVFQNCREIRWSLHGPTSADEAEADVIGFCEGKPDYAEPAVLTTDLFELSVRYHRLELREGALGPA